MTQLKHERRSAGATRSMDLTADLSSGCPTEPPRQDEFPNGKGRYGARVARSYAETLLPPVGALTVRCLLAGVPVDPGSRPPINASCVDELPWLVRSGMADTALAVIRQLEAEECVGSNLLGGLAAAAASQATVTMAVSSELGAFKDLLDSLDIPFTVLKGPATALRYPPGWSRTYTDLDLGVAPSAFSRVLAEAARAGWTVPASSTPQWNLFYRWCREGLNIHRGAVGNIDIHHHVPPWSFGRALEVSDVIRRSQVRLVDGFEVRVASVIDLLLVSCLHVLNDLSKPFASLRPWRDILVLNSQLDPEEVRQGFVSNGLGWLQELIGWRLVDIAPQVGAEWLGDEMPRLGDFWRHFRLRQLGLKGHSRVARTDFAWAARLPIRFALLYLAGSAVPSRTYVRAVDQTYRNYWRRTYAETRRSLREAA